MNLSKHIFNRKILNTRLSHYDLSSIPDIHKKKEIINRWKYSIENSDLSKTKEESVQGDFLNHFFTEILSYKKRYGNKLWHITQEQKSVFDGTKADGALGFFSSTSVDIRVVIELKDAKTDLDAKQKNRENKLTPVEQAFSYAPKAGKNCKWIVVSNFKEIRLYHSSTQSEYENFLITSLTDDEEFKRFYYLLNQENLISLNEKSTIDVFYEQNEVEQENISKFFYNDYKEARFKLFNHLKEKNHIFDELQLFEKTQKLMDRFIFVCFCEDTELLPENIFRKVIEAAKKSFDLSDTRIWSQLKGLFNSIDKGNKTMDINKFNGGLFSEDSILDSLIITDEIFPYFETIAGYGFSSDLNVNILGHIFEQSITDIEEVKAEIKGDIFPRKKGKRNADGIFYTPEFITRYIVDKTIGAWLQEKRKELGEDSLPDIPPLTQAKVSTKKSGLTKAIKRHILFWENYRDKLANIKVLDPACGSGAFLNQAFDFLYLEGQVVNNILNDLLVGQTTLLDLDKQILKNNLYGVDINKESVEITKLSLWIKTANKRDVLTTLDDNIKCGNSLIDNESIAGDKAFKWQEEFKDIFNDGGFDVVIVNPPYGALFKEEEKSYFDSHYKTVQYNYDSYRLFMELSFNLVKENGYIGLITPNTYFVIEFGNVLREFLFNNFQLMNLVEIFNVFPDAVVEPIISIYKNFKPYNNYSFPVFLVPRDIKAEESTLNNSVKINFFRDDLFRKEGYLFNYRETEEERKLCDKIFAKSEPLKKYANVTTGIKPYQKGKGIPKQTRDTVNNKPFTAFEMKDDKWKKLIRGTEVNRYLLKWNGEYINYGPWLAEPRTPGIFSKRKLFIRRTDDNIMAVYDDTGMIGLNSIHCIQVREDTNSLDLKYLLALINSKLLDWFFKHQNFHMVGKPLAEIKVVYVERLPIIIDNNQKSYIEEVDKLQELNMGMFNKVNSFTEFLTKIYQPVKISSKLTGFYLIEFNDFISELRKQKVILKEKQKYELMELYNSIKKEILLLNNEINRIESNLDKMVYELYNLTEEEMNLINKY